MPNPENDLPAEAAAPELETEPELEAEALPDEEADELHIEWAGFI